MAQRTDIRALYDEIRTGSRSALGRGLTLVESSSPADEPDRLSLLDMASEDTHDDDSSDRIAVTGVPGSGKSTLIDGLGTSFIESGRSVAVLAVDPSSDRTGGSILGDKTRMARLAAYDRAFVRPSPTRGHSGGITSTTRESILLCEAAGYDTVIVETVGTGQSETSVSQVVDLVILLLLSGAGDSLQGIKRGILEVADLVVVNKADGENENAVRRAAAELGRALHILRPDAAHPRFVRAFSALDPEDIAKMAHEVTDAIAKKRESGLLASERAAQRVAWFDSSIDEQLRRRLRRHPDYVATRDGLAEAVRTGTHDPARAARQLLDELTATGGS